MLCNSSFSQPNLDKIYDKTYHSNTCVTGENAKINKRCARQFLCQTTKIWGAYCWFPHELTLLDSCEDPLHGACLHCGKGWYCSVRDDHLVLRIWNYGRSAESSPAPNNVCGGLPDSESMHLFSKKGVIPGPAVRFPCCSSFWRNFWTSFWKQNTINKSENESWWIREYIKGSAYRISRPQQRSEEYNKSIHVVL